MALQSIGNWAALARSAASRLGTSSPAIVTAILAQWQCEQKGTWPPTRNNPGNVARGWASALSYPYTVEQPNPQPSNPIVTYPSASIGAQAYADGLRLFSRYSGVRTAVARGDGIGFLRAISAAGYGTGLACMLASYPQLLASKAAGASASGAQAGGSAKPPAPAPSGATVIKVIAGQPAAACTQIKILVPGTSIETKAIPIPEGDLGNPCVACPSGWSKAIVDPGPLRSLPLLGGDWVPLDRLEAAEKAGLLPPNTANACVAPGVKAGDSFDLGQAGDAVGNAVASAIGNLPAEIGNVLAHLGELAFIAVVLLIGLYLVARDEG